MTGDLGGAAPEDSDRPARPPWSEFRRALDAAGFRPSRRLGQNFLLDDNAARAIARDARLPPGERVVEVGPGCGFLSVHLAAAGADLVCVEVDDRLAPIAAEFLTPFPRTRIRIGDALAGKHALGPELTESIPTGGEPWHLVSNLPYAISGPLLALVADHEPPPASVTVLVQREVAERLAAAPGTAAWGPLSVAVQATFSVSLLRVLPGNLFWPRPKVESQVARMVLRPDRRPTAERRRLVALARRLLQQRRKGLRRVLADLLAGGAAADEALDRAALDPTMRAGSLGLEDLARLAAGPAGDAVARGSGR